jgi:deazaflavin-dependent oxidoreductase (nitroreductase family)
VQNRDIIEEFRSHGGRVGSYFADIPLLLLTTIGAQTGQTRTVPLSYFADGERYIVFAAAGGSPRHPDWYYNLISHSDVTVEVGIDIFDGTAVIAEARERYLLFQQFVELQPQLALYQARTTRQIPVVVLTRR